MYIRLELYNVTNFFKSFMNASFDTKSTNFGISRIRFHYTIYIFFIDVTMRIRSLSKNHA